MTGRGVDQILPYPSVPRLHESYVKTAAGYVELAEQASGPIPEGASFAYVWGDALEEFQRLAPEVKIINLETSVTTSEAYWPGKGIHYRMHPKNSPCLTAAGIDCCVLANNHVLDWGYAGLEETLRTLRQAGLKTAGAGRDGSEAAAAAAIEVSGKGRVLVFAFGSSTSGVPKRWAADADRPGVNWLADLSDATARRIAGQVNAVKRERDIVIASIHWGGNWGYTVAQQQTAFAHRLIDSAGVDLVHGHSSHHPKAIEVYNKRLILYGCGDFLNDYEGIGGYENYRSDLALMYFASVDPATGELARLVMRPTQIKRLRVNRASPEDARWLAAVLQRESRRFAVRIALKADSSLVLG